MKKNDVDDWPTPIVKLLQAHEYAQLPSNFAMQHSSKFSIADIMNMQPFMDKSRKMSISNVNKHHQKTTNSCFRSVWYDEDIIVGYYFGGGVNSILCDVVNIFLQWKMSFHTCVFRVTFYIKIDHFLEKPWKYNIWGQNDSLSRARHSENMTLSCATRHVILKREDSI